MRSKDQECLIKDLFPFKVFECRNKCMRVVTRSEDPHRRDLRFVSVKCYLYKTKTETFVIQNILKILKQLNLAT